MATSSYNPKMSLDSRLDSPHPTNTSLGINQQLRNQIFLGASSRREALLGPTNGSGLPLLSIFGRSRLNVGTDALFCNMVASTISSIVETRSTKSE